MSRRYHKKSKAGCSECKRRHIRCDEGRPSCANCTAAQTRCPFLDPNEPAIVPGLLLPGTASFSSANARDRLELTPTSGDGADIHKPRTSYDLDMSHLQIYQNLHGPDFRSLDNTPDGSLLSLNTCLEYGFQASYLMHQFMATSALHLSITQVNMSDVYQRYAAGFQNRALQLFHEANPIMQTTQENCVPVFLFSVFVGVHLIGNALHHERSDLDTFITAYTRGIDVYRGVVAVAEASVELLQASNVAYSLRSAEIFEASDSVGSECQALQMMANALQPQEKRSIYGEVVLRLQQTFDAHANTPPDEARSAIVLAWPLHIPAKFDDLLRQQEPEALAVMAHFAVLLHRGRQYWLFGDGGRFVILKIREMLGVAWHNVLRYPLSILNADSSFLS